LNVITNEADPEIAFARKGAQKLSDFIERLHNLLDTAYHEVETKTYEPMRQALETLLTGPKESRRMLERTAASLEGVRKRYRETVAAKKTTPAKIREAQDEQDSARAAFNAAEKEAVMQAELSSSVVCSQCPRLFSVFFRAHDKVFREGAQMLQDSESYYSARGQREAARTERGRRRAGKAGGRDHRRRAPEHRSADCPRGCMHKDDGRPDGASPDLQGDHRHLPRAV
jgi:hypothetical protein